MKRIYSVVLGLAMGLTLAAPSFAALRVPQVAFNSASLQSRMNGFGESINVLTQQQDGLVWGSTISTNSTMTIQYQLSGNPHANEIGIAKLNAAGNVVTGLATVFPATSAPGMFAVASFRPGNLLIVNLFDANANLVGQTSTSGVNRSLFGYYIKNAGATSYTHEGFNADGKVHSLAFAGTGINTGSWWLAWEDAPITTYSGADFDDALLFMESINPTPVAQTTWGSLKARFR